MDTVGKLVPNNVVTPNQPYFDLFYWSKTGPYYQVITLDKHIQKQVIGNPIASRGHSTE